MKISILMLVMITPILLIAGQASVSLAAPGDSDEKTFITVNCSGHGKDWPDCYREAEALCPEGYYIIEKSTGIVSAPINGRYTLVPSRKMEILCK